MHKHIIFPFVFLICLSGLTAAQEKPEVPDSLKTVCERIEKTVTAGDHRVLAAHMDMNRMVAPYFKDLPDSKMKREFIAGASQGTDNLAKSVARATGEMGSYELVNFVKRDGGLRAVFRLNSEAGLNYHELTFTPSDPHKIIDIYVYMTGNTIGETMKATFRTLAASQGFLGAISGKQKEMEGDMRLFERMMGGMRSGDHEGILRAYNGMKGPLKQEKPSRMLAMTAAMGKGDDNLYEQLLEDYIKAFPKDPSIALVSMDYYILQGKYDTALGMIDKLDKRVDGDPYLDILRVNVHLMDDDVEKAEAAVKRAVKGMPNSSEALIGLFDVYNAKKKYPSAIKVLDHLAEKHEIIMPHGLLSADPSYAELVKTDEYKVYKEYIEENYE